MYPEPSYSHRVNRDKNAWYRKHQGTFDPSDKSLRREITIIKPLSDQLVSGLKENSQSFS